MLDTSSAPLNAQLIAAFPRKSKKRSKLKCPCRNSKCKYNRGKTSGDHPDHASEILDRVEPPPVHPKGSLILEFISTIERLNLRYSWCGFLPSRIGRNVALDAAARAIIAAQKYRARRDRATANLECESYAQAVSILRTEIDSSDDSLATVALLTLREQILGRDVDSVIKHDDGIAAILLARPQSTPISDLARSVLFECCRLAKTGRPCAAGVPSPFEGTYWEDLEPAYPFLGTMAKEALRLRKVSHKLSIRFPGLIVAVRAVREGTADETQIGATFALARELLETKDDGAEKVILGNLKTITTINKVDQVVIPTSFKFRSPNEIAVVLSYWTARAVVVRNCLMLSATEHGHLIAPSGKKHLYVATKLAQDQLRLATNILMSWQYTSQIRLMVLLMAPLKIIWGVFDPDESEGRTGLAPLQIWILDRFHELGWPAHYGEKEMRCTSSAFAGGPITGNFRLVVA